LNIAKKYFDTLGIVPTTDKAIIKKAYRKLAFKYHPDVNASKEAHLKFIEITEAYEICIGEKLITNKGNVKANKSPQQEREERMQRAREFYRQTKIREEIENRLFFESLISGKKWKFLKFFSVVSALFAVLVLIDYHLPSKDFKGEFMSYSYENGFLKANISNETYYLKSQSIVWSGLSKYVVLKRSVIFNDVKEIVFINKDNRFVNLKPEWTFFELYWLFVLLFLLPLFVVIYKRPTALFTFLYSISIYIIPLIFIIVLLTRNRFGIF